MSNSEQVYEVWCNINGCLPESDQPEFVGSLAECEAYRKQEYRDKPEAFSGLYTLNISEHVCGRWCDWHEPC